MYFPASVSINEPTVSFKYRPQNAQGYLRYAKTILPNLAGRGCTLIGGFENLKMRADQ